MDHGNQIFTEQKLAVGVIFRCDDTDALVIVDREQNFLRQLSGQERADDLAAIHADDGLRAQAQCRAPDCIRASAV